MRARASRFIWTAAFAAALFLCALHGAEAGSAAFCVTCKGPDQTYLCHVTGDDVGRNDAAKLYCVVRTAKEGGHASCGAREATADCHGVEKIYSYDGPSIPEELADDPRVKKAMKRIEKEQKAFEKDDDRKSLVEVTGEALSASRRGWRNMRASIGGHDEANQSSTPSSASPSHSAAQRPMPPMADGTPTLPLSAAPETAAPPVHRSGVSSFARNTYRCVRSLFRRCHGETEVQGSN